MGQRLALMVKHFGAMIFLTRLNRLPFVVNSDLIEHIEMTPDTVIALTTGEKILVCESAEEVVARTVQFRRTILDGLNLMAATSGRGYLQDSSALENTVFPNADRSEE